MQINGIDEKDNRIVNLLRQNGRMSCSEIGAQIGLSRTAVKNRITALEQSGIIRGYTAVIDPQAAPQMLTFVTTIITEPGAYDEVAERLKGEKCVVTLCQISGECELHAICVAESLEEMRAFAKRMRSADPRIKLYKGQMVLEVMKGSVLPE